MKKLLVIALITLGAATANATLITLPTIGSQGSDGVVIFQPTWGGAGEPVDADPDPSPLAFNSGGWEVHQRRPIAPPVPESATMVLLGFGFFGLAILSKRRMTLQRETAG